MSRIDIPKIVSEELQLSNERGFPSEIINGGKHFKVFVCGRLAGVLSRGPNHEADRAARNLRSSIRRIVKEQSSAQK